MTERRKVIIQWVIFLTTLPYIILTLYVTPAADDFAFANRISSHGWLGVQVEYYTGWTGRYTSTFVMTTISQIGDYLSTYKVYPLLLLVLSFVSMWFAFSALARRQAFSKKGIWPSLFMLVVYINSMPTVAEGFYWLSGAYTYQLGHVLLASVIGMLFVKWPKEKAKEIGFYMLLVVFCCLLPGCSEIVSFATLSFLFAGALVAYKLQLPNRHRWGLAFVIMSCCFAIVFFAPGNAIRAQHFPNRHNLSVVIPLFSGSLWAVVKAWLFYPFLLVAFVLMLPFSRYVSKIYRLPVLKMKWIIAVGLYSTLVFVGAIFLTCWSMGSRLPDRTGNAFLMILLTAVFIVAILVVNRIPVECLSVRRHRGFTLVWLVFFGLLLGNSNFTEAGSDLVIAGQYKTRWQHRYALVREAKHEGIKKLTLPPINYPNCPRTIAYFDFTLDPENWTNQAFARYFGLEKVKISIPEEFREIENEGSSRASRNTPKM